MRHLQLIFPTLLLFVLMAFPPAHAGTPMSDRVAVEAKVRADVGKDLARHWQTGIVSTEGQ